MVKEELVARSPVRIFMNSIHGGLAAGEIGLVAAPNGIGKTSVLVQIALDKLLQDLKVIHVSFTQHADYVTAWYEDIFNEFIKKKNLEHEAEVKDELLKNRVTMKFNQDAFSADQILNSLRAMIKEGGFPARYVIVDGYKFSDSDGERISKVKEFAAEMGLSVWYSCSTAEGKNGGKPYDEKGVPNLVSSYADLFSAVIVLDPKQDHIAMEVVKDKEQYNPEQMSLKLDPRTLLLIEE
jgi:hypothetical protein